MTKSISSIVFFFIIINFQFSFGQSDTLVNNESQNYIKCEGNSGKLLSEGEIIDTNTCFMYCLHATNINKLFYYYVNYFHNYNTYAKGYAVAVIESPRRRILFLTIKKEKASIQYDGKWNYYYRSGKIKIEGKYSLGAKSGKWKYYDEAGNLIKEENFDK